MSNLRYFGNINYGSLKDLDVLVDPSDKSILVTYPTIEKILGYQPEHAHEKLGAKKLKAFAGKALLHTKKSVDATDVMGRVRKNKNPQQVKMAIGGQLSLL